jgi:hypothetical protein
MEYNKIEGKLKIAISEEIIDGILDYETGNAEVGIINLNKWALPHWTAIKSVSIGAVSISRTTAEYIIERLRLVVNDPGQTIMMIWMNYGWSVDESLKDNQCVINFHKINYGESNGNKI